MSAKAKRKGNKEKKYRITSIKALAVVDRETGEIFKNNHLYSIYSPDILKGGFYKMPEYTIEDVIITIRQVIK